jgi:hypothetical protein
MPSPGDAQYIRIKVKLEDFEGFEPEERHRLSYTTRTSGISSDCPSFWVVILISRN